MTGNDNIHLLPHKKGIDLRVMFDAVAAENLDEVIIIGRKEGELLLWGTTSNTDVYLSMLLRTLLRIAASGPILPSGPPAA